MEIIQSKYNAIAKPHVSFWMKFEDLATPSVCVVFPPTSVESILLPLGLWINIAPIKRIEIMAMKKVVPNNIIAFFVEVVKNNKYNVFMENDNIFR